MKPKRNLYWLKKRTSPSKEQKINQQYWLNRERNQRFYHSIKWNRLRLLVLADEPLCYDCLNKHPSVLTPAVEVHHKLNINTSTGWAQRFNVDGLIGLCKPCHSQHTVEELQQRKEEERKIKTNKRMNDLNNI